MKETKQARLEPYFGLWRGNTAKYSELGDTAHLVDIFVAEGKANRQYDLFGDSTVWFPEKVKQLADFKRRQIEQYQRQLDRSVIL